MRFPLAALLALMLLASACSQTDVADVGDTIDDIVAEVTEDAPTPTEAEATEAATEADTEEAAAGDLGAENAVEGLEGEEVDMTDAPLATIDTGQTYRLTTVFQEPDDKCLEGNAPVEEAVLQGSAFMDDCQEATGQLWNFEESSNGSYTMTTEFRSPEGECLEGNGRESTVQDGAAFMRPCVPQTGQQWKIIDVGNDHYRLQVSTPDQPNTCLEGNEYPDGSVKSGAAFMDVCQNVTGQLWIFNSVDQSEVDEAVDPEIADTQAVTLAPDEAPDEFARTPWQMLQPADPNGPLVNGTQVDRRGAIENYVDVEVPAQSDADWGPAPDPELIRFDGSLRPAGLTDDPAQDLAQGGDWQYERWGGTDASRLAGLYECGQAVDYTYFQTIVNVPSQDDPYSGFQLSFTGDRRVDDGAQIRIYNTDNPGGAVAENSYVQSNAAESADLSSFLAPGLNRIVLTQIDDCPGGNNLGAVTLRLDGEDLPVDPDLL